ncbi:MAG: NADH-quinone oxidoreductase subunit NuoK [Sphingobacteriia bacterium]|nr:NADH-quinone oxidoreductase subunit NuoK [Sphingobacteriia bacterium]
MNISIFHYLILSAILFTIGVAGIFINRRNIIVILMCVELMLLAVNINFVAASMKLGQLTGQVFSIFILTVAAAEAAIGLAILVIYYRNRNSVSLDDVNQMRG